MVLDVLILLKPDDLYKPSFCRHTRNPSGFCATEGTLATTNTALSNCENPATGLRLCGVVYANSQIPMNMEPPIKRRRLAENSYPEIDLHARRAQSTLRLKSTWDSICERYGRDFEGIGDEIDLMTGRIVVNNGHIERMTSERDIGDHKYSTKELGDSDLEDDQSLTECSEENSDAQGSANSGDVAVIEGSEASAQSDFEVDSLIGDVLGDSHLHQHCEKSPRVVSIPSDGEEDELASSDVEWTSYNNGRPGVQERFRLLKDKTAFADDPAIEPMWRASPLPIDTRLEREGAEVRLTSVDNMREYSDDERAGISLWTPELPKRRGRKKASANSVDQRSLSVARCQENLADELPSNPGDSEPAPRKWVRWTQEEEELLIHLKTTTDLSDTAMKPYFPGRPRNAVASHWAYMIHCGKVSAILARGIPLSSLSSNTDRPASNGTRQESHDPNTISEKKEPQTVQEQINERSPEAENFVHSSSKLVAHIADHRIDSSHKIVGDHRTLTNGPISNNDDVGAHIGVSTDNPFSSEKDSGCTIAESAYQVNSNGGRVDAAQSYSVSKPSDIDDGLPMRERDCASKQQGQLLEFVSKNGCGAREASASTSVKADFELKGAEPFSDGIDSSEIHSQDTTPVEGSSSPKRGTRSDSEIQREESIPPTAEDIIQTKEPTAQRLQKTQSTKLISTTSSKQPNHDKSSASREPDVDLTSKTCINRQIVQVVIPLAPLSQPNVRLPLAATENEDPAFARQLSATPESVSAALGPSLPHQENLAIRFPSRSPSVAVAESQYAASAAFNHDGIRTSPGPEVADSQPLSTVPVKATSLPELGEVASRPIVLDVESPPLRMSPSVAPSAEKQLQEATKSVILEYDSQPLCVTSGTATPAQNRIEEATESDILESGSHPLSKPPSKAQKLSKRAKKATTAESASSIWTAIDDYSEDELSYL